MTLSVRPPEDLHGLRSVPGAADRYHARELRRFRSQRQWVHKTRNGVWDPLTQMHVVDAVMNAEAGVEFTAKQFCEFLSAWQPHFSWDAVTVGRILTELIDGLEAVLDVGDQPLFRTHRRASGFAYYIAARPKGWEVLHAVRNELALEAEADLARRGGPARRYASPLADCVALQPPVSTLD